jgi:hypothetical protein
MSTTWVLSPIRKFVSAGTAIAAGQVHKIRR